MTSQPDIQMMMQQLQNLKLLVQQHDDTLGFLRTRMLPAETIAMVTSPGAHGAPGAPGAPGTFSPATSPTGVAPSMEIVARKNNTSNFNIFWSNDVGFFSIFIIKHCDKCGSNWIIFYGFYYCWDIIFFS